MPRLSRCVATRSCRSPSSASTSRAQCSASSSVRTRARTSITDPRGAAMAIADVRKNAEQKMQKSLEALKVDLGKVRTGRAHTGILDHVMVDYYGSPTPVPQVANVTLIDARTIGVTPWDKKMVGAV